MEIPEEILKISFTVKELLDFCKEYDKNTFPENQFEGISFVQDFLYDTKNINLNESDLTRYCDLKSFWDKSEV